MGYAAIMVLIKICCISRPWIKGATVISVQAPCKRANRVISKLYCLVSAVNMSLYVGLVHTTSYRGYRLFGPNTLPAPIRLNESLNLKSL